MVPKMNLARALVLLTLAFGSQPWASAQESTRQDSQVKTLETGTLMAKSTRPQAAQRFTKRRTASWSFA